MSSSRRQMLGRIRRLESPAPDRARLQAELDRLRAEVAASGPPDFSAMTDEQLHEYISGPCERDPWVRIAALERQLETPAQRRERERAEAEQRAMFEAMTDAELNAYAAARCRPASETLR